MSWSRVSTLGHEPRLPAPYARLDLPVRRMISAVRSLASPNDPVPATCSAGVPSAKNDPIALSGHLDGDVSGVDWPPTSPWPCRLRHLACRAVIPLVAGVDTACLPKPTGRLADFAFCRIDDLFA